MLSFFWIVFWIGLLGLMVASGISLRSRLRTRLGATVGGAPRVDDEAVRRILEEGVLVTDEDEPLDLEEIEDQERRFWSESWEDPEEW